MHETVIADVETVDKAIGGLRRHRYGGRAPRNLNYLLLNSNLPFLTSSFPTINDNLIQLLPNIFLQSTRHQAPTMSAPPESINLGNTQADSPPQLGEIPHPSEMRIPTLSSTNGTSGVNGNTSMEDAKNAVYGSEVRSILLILWLLSADLSSSLVSQTARVTPDRCLIFVT